MGALRGAQAAPAGAAQPPTARGSGSGVSPAWRWSGSGGEEGVGRRPAANLEPHACPLLPPAALPAPAALDASPQQSQGEPTLRKPSLKFSSLIRGLTRSQGGRRWSSEVHVSKCRFGFPTSRDPHTRKNALVHSSKSLVYVLPPCRHSLEFLRGDERHQDGHVTSRSTPPVSHGQPVLDRLRISR